MRTAPKLAATLALLAAPALAATGTADASQKLIKASSSITIAPYASGLTGVVSTSKPDTCRKNRDVVIFRAEGNRWVKHGRTGTDATGRFRYTTTEKGQYTAVVQSVNRQYACQKAESRRVFR